MRSLRQELPISRKGAVFCAFLAVAMVLGGGGSPSARPEILVQLSFAAAAFAWFAWASAVDRTTLQIPRPLLAIAGILVAIPLLQLIPLPPAVWLALPGRALQGQALEITGAGDTWRSLSIAPHETFAALLAIIPAIGVMLAAAQLSLRDRNAVYVTVVLVALAGAALGVLQMAGGPEEFRIYERSHRGWLVAFHANRNAAADVFLIAALAMAAWSATRARRHGLSGTGLGIFATVQSVLLAALLMTGSRTGIALGLVVIVFHLAMFRSADVAFARKKLAAISISVGALLLAAIGWFASSTRISGVMERFDAQGDTRFELWADSWTAAESFFPLGSGLGTFPLAFQPFERLLVVDDLFPNRAHNDYLEFLIETGVLAPLAILIGLFCIVKLARQTWQIEVRAGPSLLFALGTVLVIALHSIVDYPLRNMAIAVLAGAACGMVARIPNPRSQEEQLGADIRAADK